METITPVNRVAMQEELMHIFSDMEIDFSFQKDDMYRRMRRLICFDIFTENVSYTQHFCDFCESVEYLKQMLYFIGKYFLLLFANSR